MRKHYLTTDESMTMNASYNIFKFDKLIFEDIDGQVTLQNLISYNNYLIADPEYSEEYNMVADLRDTDIILSLIEIPRFVDYFNSIPGKGRKLALILSPTYCQLFSTILRANQSKLNLDIKFFKSLKSALNWIEKSELTSSFKRIIEEAKVEHKLVS